MSKNMSKKKLLVLAASRYQIPTITTAKRLGYYVITTDNVPENPGHALADKSFDIDTTDRQAVLDIATREHIDGIISAATDVAVPTAAYVAEQLGLPGVPVDSAYIVCDKVSFRQFLCKHGFPVPEAYAITLNYRPEADFFKRHWIIKPDRSSGSKGIFILNSKDDFHQRLTETLSFSTQSRGIIEEFIEGFQGTCEGIVTKGELVLTFILDRQTVSPPYVATSGHHFPTLLPSHLQKKLFSVLKEILRALGIADTTFDCDFVATNDEVYIIELSPRMGGNSISSLLKKATGFDLIEYSVHKACHNTAILPKKIKTRPTAVVLLGLLNKGLLFYDQVEAEAMRKEEWVDSLTLDTGLGEQVLPFINGRHRVGEAFVFGRDRADLDDKVIELKRRLDLKAI
jgi:biotin carboxylase